MPIQLFLVYLDYSLTNTFFWELNTAPRMSRKCDFSRRGSSLSLMKFFLLWPETLRHVRSSNHFSRWDLCQVRMISQKSKQNDKILVPIVLVLFNNHRKSHLTNSMVAVRHSKYLSSSLATCCFLLKTREFLLIRSRESIVGLRMFPYKLDSNFAWVCGRRTHSS